jgi:hypothetical protein
MWRPDGSLHLPEGRGRYRKIVPVGGGKAGIHRTVERWLTHGGGKRCQKISEIRAGSSCQSDESGRRHAGRCRIPTVPRLGSDNLLCDQRRSYANANIAIEGDGSELIIALEGVGSKRQMNSI